METFDSTDLFAIQGILDMLNDSSVKFNGTVILYSGEPYVREVTVKFDGDLDQHVLAV